MCLPILCAWLEGRFPERVAALGETSGVRYNKLAMGDFDRTPLYLQIAESIRQEIIYGSLGAGL